MPRYRALDDNWVYIPSRTHKENDWKVAMLGYRGARGDLTDIHILATKPSGRGFYSDAHVTFVLGTKDKEHIYYQVNGNRLVADYALAPHGWRGTLWVKYPEMRECTEAEIANFVAYCRAEKLLDRNPTPID